MTWILFEELPSTCDEGTLRRHGYAKRRVEQLMREGPDGLTFVKYSSADVTQIKKVGPRNLPRVRDIMDFVCLGMRLDLGGFMNSDIYVTSRGAKVLAKIKPEDADIVLLHRSDIHTDYLEQVTGESECLVFNEVHQPEPVNHAISCDGWLCRPNVWKELREWYPKQMLIGEPWWDSCAIALSTHFKDRFKVKHIHKGELLHPRHRGVWEDLSKEAIQARDAHFHLKALMKGGVVV